MESFEKNIKEKDFDTALNLTKKISTLIRLQGRLSLCCQELIQSKHACGLKCVGRRYANFAGVECKPTRKADLCLKKFNISGGSYSSITISQVVAERDE